MAKTMSKKEFFRLVANNEISAEVIEKAKTLYENAVKSDEKREKNKTENRGKNIELANQICALIGNRWLAASEILTLTRDNPDIPNTSKVTAICRVGVEEGLLEVRDDYKVGGKGSKVKAYKPIEQTADEPEEEEEEENGEW